MGAWVRVWFGGLACSAGGAVRLSGVVGRACFRLCCLCFEHSALVGEGGGVGSGVVTVSVSLCVCMPVNVNVYELRLGFSNTTVRVCE